MPRGTEDTLVRVRGHLVVTRLAIRVTLFSALVHYRAFYGAVGHPVGLFLGGASGGFEANSKAVRSSKDIFAISGRGQG